MCTCACVWKGALITSMHRGELPTVRAPLDPPLGSRAARTGDGASRGAPAVWLPVMGDLQGASPWAGPCSALHPDGILLLVLGCVQLPLEDPRQPPCVRVHVCECPACWVLALGADGPPVSSPDPSGWMVFPVVFSGLSLMPAEAGHLCGLFWPFGEPRW